ncbi:PREDICTED: 28S ribosomal protein S5, mitochondrial [Nanorana parkeri]|uniref:28S ribosomal protein S5, mitochondrial n=1 Tax=Nanorana parkeri TaxID=125878 RepID=UPI000854F818|nr:PREDICTED: 28S ribosomal protein S5, mitochondrial [Nanorana parkeri]
MAAVRWCSGVLRSVYRGGISAPVIRTSCQFHSLRLPQLPQEPCYLSTYHNVSIQQARLASSFFGKLTANELWKGVLADTSGGSRKGRGKRTKKRIKKNLNVGQRIGDGKSGFLWPGLNSPIVLNKKEQNIEQRNKEQQEERQAQIFKERDQWEKKKKTRVRREERGWTGRSWGGLSVGKPDPGPNGEKYEDFECRVIELKSVFTMTAKEGRKRSMSALVVVGNGNGAAGFAVGKSNDRAIALRKAKNRAVHYLHYVERYNNHTIYHDITTKFKRTTIKMKKQNPGYGLHCHRAIITICKLIGIKDMYARLSGSHNLLNITNALFQGLTKQETHQELASRKGLHVVEFRDECGPLPRIVATPHGPLSTVPEPEGEIVDTPLDWDDVKVTQGIKRSVWANVKRTIW